MYADDSRSSPFGAEGDANLGPEVGIDGCCRGRYCMPSRICNRPLGKWAVARYKDERDPAKMNGTVNRPRIVARNAKHVNPSRKKPFCEEGFVPF